MKLKAIFIVAAAFVFVAFGLRLATYAERNLSTQSMKPAVVSIAKTPTISAITQKIPGRSLRNPLKSLKLSLLSNKIFTPIYFNHSARAQNLTLDLTSIDLCRLHRPPANLV